MKPATGLPVDRVTPGHIEGVWLPRRAWLALERDRIGTLAQLAAIAPRIERIIPGIGGKTARAIREQLAGIVLPGAAGTAVADDGAEGFFEEAVEWPDGPVAGEGPALPDGAPVATTKRVLRAMIVWRAVCPHCGTREVHVAEAPGTSI